MIRDSDLTGFCRMNVMVMRTFCVLKLPTKLEDGNPAPQASAIDSIIPEQGGFVTLLVLDMEAYAEKYGNKAVRKNLTIPAWLNTFAACFRMDLTVRGSKSPG